MKKEGLKPGDSLQHFKILRILGAGGMGEVYLALDTIGNRHVAIKVIKPGIPKFERKLRLFLREVDLYRQISHPNIVNYVASGEVDGLHYVALEHIVGISLRQWLARNGSCPLKKAFSWTQDLVFALHAAHQQGVIHRDIKPENIMVTDDEMIKIIDFGLARTEGGIIEGFVGRSDAMLKRGRPRDGRLTGESGVVGTLSYLAPEVILGNKIGPATDIFALGLVVYEMLTGKILMSDINNAADIINNHNTIDCLQSFIQNEEGPLVDEFEHFIQKMLKANLSSRFSSTSTMVSAMEDLVSKFGAELQDSQAQTGKKLAKQELLDSHFWTAKNLLADGDIEQGICEMEKILTFANSIEILSKDHIQKELDYLCYYLQIYGGNQNSDVSIKSRHGNVTKTNRRMETSSGNYAVSEYTFSREKYVELYTKVLRIYKVVGDKHCLRLKIKRFCRILKKHYKPYELAPVIHPLMAEHMGNPELTALFIWTMEDANAGVAKDIWLRFVGELTAHGLLLDSRRELNQFKKAFAESDIGFDEELHSRESDLSLLEREEEEAERVTLSLVNYMLSSSEREKAIRLCTSFISKYPFAGTIISRLISLYKDENRLHQLTKFYHSLGIASYYRGEVYNAIASFVHSVEAGGHNLVAFNFLFEMLDAQGGIRKMPSTIRELRCYVYKSFGATSLAIKELEKSLTGTRGDRSIYKEIAKMARESGNNSHLWKALVNLGRLKMELKKFKSARKLFDKAVTVAPVDEKKGAAKMVKDISGIREIYSMKEMAQLSSLGLDFNSGSTQSGVNTPHECVKHESTGTIDIISLRQKIKQKEKD